MSHYSDFYAAESEAALMREAGLYKEWVEATAEYREQLYWKARAVVAEGKLDNIKSALSLVVQVGAGGIPRTI
jgi:hypothetical protein